MKKYSYPLVFILLALFSVQAVYNVLEKSPTFDEPNWMKIAWYLTHTWSWQGDYHVLMHPPLSFYIHGIPLRIIEWWGKSSPKVPPEGALAAQFPYPYSKILSYNAVFTITKLSMLPFAVLLGFYIFFWATQLYDIWAGLFALTLYVFNPYMIAYATMITSDMLATCFMFIATYYFWKFCKQASIRHIFLAGVALAFALLSKVSALLLILAFFILWLSVVLKILRQKPREKESPSPNPSHEGRGIGEVRRLLIGLCLILCIAGFLVEAGFLFDMQPVRSFHAAQSSDLVYRLFKDIPIPFGAFINSIRLHQSFISSMTRKQFLAGQVSTHTWWYYHVLTVLFKNPVPFLVFWLSSIVYWAKKGNNFLRQELFLIVPAVLVFLYFSFLFPLNVSSRFVLPVYPFLFVLMSRIITFDVLKRFSVRVVFGALILWYLLSTVSIFPHYLAYCNELIGGTKNGYTWFADSSYDWGQDLKGLGQYMKENQILAIKLAYFGKAIPEYYGIRYIPLHEPQGCRATKGLIAISTTRLQGVYEQNQACFSWLKQYEPIDKIGYSIFIYYIQ